MIQQRHVLRHLEDACFVAGGICKEIEVSLSASMARHRLQGGTVQCR
jgi:hypothetical protein